MEEEQNPYEPSKTRQKKDGKESRKFSLVSCLVWILISPFLVVGCVIVLLGFTCGGIVVLDIIRSFFNP